MHKIGVVQQKGGVGKTGLSAGAAGALAERGRRVLVGDLDPQGHLTVSALRMSRIAQGAPSLAGALAGDYDGPAKDLVVPHTQLPGEGVIDVLPTSLRMFTVARDLDKRPDRERQLGRLLDELAGDYDYCLLDGPPALDILTDNILAAANGVLIPVQPDDSSIEALRILLSQVGGLERALRRDPIDLLGLVLSNFRRPMSLIDRSVVDSLRQLDVPLIAELALAVVVKESWRAGQPVTAYQAESESAEAYRRVADVLDRAANLAPFDRKQEGA